MSTVIKVENVSKLYRLGEVGTGTLSHDLRRWWYRLRGKEDPYLKIGQINDRTQRAEKGEMVWALKDIFFEVNDGEVLGIIGKNGAGKSTLLKILSRITSPTEGEVKIKGRIASLLEVGTGFHPEMTGRENIYMNGTIMGMRKYEIDHRLDEIVEFAGIAKYLDTPVKRYSSGMTIRLGFAVAAHLDAEILLVDEVLAVGDAEFQKKALGKMQEVSRTQGRTVLFVSHNMGAVQSLCSKGMLLDKGMIIFKGNTIEAIEEYIKNQQIIGNKIIDRNGTGDVIVTEIEICDENNNRVDAIPAGNIMKVKLKYLNKNPQKKYNLIPGISIKTVTDIKISTHHTKLIGLTYQHLPKTGTFEIKINKLPLTPGNYLLSYALVNHLYEIVDASPNQIKFTVIEGNYYGTGQTVPPTHGIFMLEAEWKLLN